MPTVLQLIDDEFLMFDDDLPSDSDNVDFLNVELEMFASDLLEEILEDDPSGL